MHSYLNSIAAAVQIAPPTFDMRACVSKICDYVDVAADQNAQLVVFGEMCAGGYPGWRPSFMTYGDDEFLRSESTWRSKELFKISETIPGPSTEKLCQKAKNRGVFLVTGFAEADPHITGTIYNYIYI